MKNKESLIYETWLRTADGDLLHELSEIKNDENEITDRFYRSLEFGTGGLRGVVGAGTNRMNIHTVAHITGALADWLNDELSKLPNLPNFQKSVAIAYDSRHKSDEFSRIAASVFAANGIEVYIFPELQPTPILSYAVRELKCSAGVVITASHNPAKYNGYKCYGADGCQFTDKNAREVAAYMARNRNIFNVKIGDFDELLKQGKIKYIGGDLIEKYFNNVLALSAESEKVKKAPLHVVYTPLCGAGNKPVREILSRIGISVTVVKEQEQPDGNFPGCPRPNPEIKEAFDFAFKLADDLKRKNNPADLLLATDPDCDRVGAAVLDTKNGGYTLMSGNEVGALMLDYLLSRRKANGTLPENPVAVKTIVTTSLADRICEQYNCELKTCLTGFKYIGEIISGLEKKGEAERFILGFEESYGYLAGSYARDKDAVFGSMIICEMAAYYKSQGKTLLDVMNELYERHGYYIHSQLNAEFEGREGAERIKAIMKELRDSEREKIGDVKIIRKRDYLNNNSAKADVIEFLCEDDSVLTARPSGTEPKIKFYLTAAGKTPRLSRHRIEELEQFARASLAR